MDTLGQRIKRYEAASKITLTPRSPVIIRIDGQHFHTYTRNAVKPYDPDLIDAMVMATHRTVTAMQGFKLAYVQSDEVTFLLTDYDKIESQGWFGYELNKLVSISASHFTANFNHQISTAYLDREMEFDGPRFASQLATFDSRAFAVPRDDVFNVFVWRQQDWYRNSVQMLAQSIWSPKQLHGKSLKELQRMLRERGTPWSQLNPRNKYGTFVLPNGVERHEYMDYEMLQGMYGDMIRGTA